MGLSSGFSAPAKSSPEVIAQTQSRLRMQEALPTQKALKQRLNEQRLKLREESGYNDQDRSESGLADWRPVKAQYPVLIFETQNQMDDLNAPDMVHGDESRQKIESYGFMRPFLNEMRYSPSQGHDVVSEDQFTLPVESHFERMRDLGSGLSFSMLGDTAQIFDDMVDKFQRNEGGYFRNLALDKELQQHKTTKNFHATLMNCLSLNIQNGILAADITSKTSSFMASSSGAGLPKFEIGFNTLLDGTVLTVHDIWSMRVYAEKLEYKGDKIRGRFQYEIQDHFGLDTADVNHPIPNLNNKPYEVLEGFRSWYLLQHFGGYNYQPFVTQIYFNMVF